MTTSKEKQIIYELKEKIKELNKTIAELEDENQSLWDMLDEITESDISELCHNLKLRDNSIISELFG